MGDIDGSGALSLTEFRNCCRDADIGLTRKEINVLMHQCDMDGDGNISYEEFVPLCFEMLTEILKDELLENKRTPSELEARMPCQWDPLHCGHPSLPGTPWPPLVAFCRQHVVWLGMVAGSRDASLRGEGPCQNWHARCDNDEGHAVVPRFGPHSTTDPFDPR